MDQNIFISYRRGDSEGIAIRIYDRLQDYFGVERVFMDVADFNVSENFEDIINLTISSCGVVIVIIGPHWDSITDEMGRNRLDDPHDFVRMEVLAALNRDVLIVPVLVNREKMPNIKELPYDLQALTQYTPIVIHSRRFDTDFSGLISEIEHYFGKTNKKYSSQNFSKNRLSIKIGAILIGILIIGLISLKAWFIVESENENILLDITQDISNDEIAFVENNLTITPKSQLPDEMVTPSQTPTMLPSKTSSATITLIPTPTPTLIDTILAPEITDLFGVSMVLIPQGPFIMGTNGNEPWNIVSRPASLIGLDMFYIDKYEVSIGQYADCVLDNVCNPPSKNRSKTRTSYFGNKLYTDFPVIYVSWKDASTYCSWRGGRLPIESEWEKAARGEDEREYPWGAEQLDCLYANFKPEDACEGDTISVDSLLLGASPYGVMNMSGNVSEWVQDWFQAYPGGDPGATKEYGVTHRVVRGGAYFDSPNNIRTISRIGLIPETSYSYVGFRCVVDIEALP